jgi:hypothetical protein
MMSKGMFRKNHSIALDSFANFSVAVLSQSVIRGRKGEQKAGSEGHTARDEKTAEAGGSEEIESVGFLNLREPPKDG